MEPTSRTPPEAPLTWRAVLILVAVCCASMGFTLLAGVLAYRALMAWAAK